MSFESLGKIFDFCFTQYTPQDVMNPPNYDDVFPERSANLPSYDELEHKRNSKEYTGGLISKHEKHENSQIAQFQEKILNGTMTKQHAKYVFTAANRAVVNNEYSFASLYGMLPDKFKDFELCEIARKNTPISHSKSETKRNMDLFKKCMKD